MENMNLLAIAAAAVLNMVLGYLWYSPTLFAKQWMKARGMKDMGGKEGMGLKYFLTMCVSVLTAVILAWFVSALNATTFVDGVKIGFLGWLGLTTTAQLNNWLFSKAPKELYFIDTGYQLVGYSLMGGILAALK